MTTAFDRARNARKTLRKIIWYSSCFCGYFLAPILVLGIFNMNFKQLMFIASLLLLDLIILFLTKPTENEEWEDSQ